MSSKKDQKNESIIPSSNRGLARYSSELIGRGLDLAKELEQSRATVKADRQVIGINPDDAKPQMLCWKCVHSLTGHSNRVTSIAISPDGNTLVSGDDGIIKLWHLQTGKLLHSITVDSAWCLYRKVAISPDGQCLACLTKNTVRIYCLQTAELLHTLTCSDEDDEFSEVFFSPDGYTVATIATIDSDPTLQIWNLCTGKLLSTYQGYPVAISPDWQTFACPDWLAKEGAIEILNLNTGELLSTVSGGHSTSVNSVAFSPDGKTLASCGWDYDRDSDTKDHTLKIWSLYTGELIHTLTHSDEVSCVAFSPDGQTLVSVCGVYGNLSENKTIKIWSLKTGELIHTLNSYYFTPDFTFSPDGQNLVVPYQWKIQIWHLRTGKLLGIITLKDSNSARRVAFSPDGQTLAIGCSDSTLMIWQLSSVEISANDWYKRGADKLDRRDFQGAIEDFNQALQLNPNLTEVYYYRGRTHAALGDYQRAIEDFQKAAALFIEQGKHADAYVSQGNACFVNGDTQKAIEKYTKAIQINPNYTTAYRNRGIAHHKLEDNYRAIEDLQKAAKLYSEQESVASSQEIIDFLKKL